MRRALLLLACAAVALLVAGCTTPPQSPASAPTPNATLVLNGSTSVTLSYEDVLALPSVSGVGGAVSTTGIRYGPFQIKGVSLRTLAEQVGGIGPNQTLRVHAPDGYMWVLGADQIDGEGFIVFTPELKEIDPPPAVIPVLMYEQNGTALSEELGGPFRIAVLNQEGTPVITEGSGWVKWVDRIEVR